MTDKLRAAAEAALEAMDALHRTGDTQVFDLCHRETTEALRAALAEPVQPVAFPDGYEPHELPADYTGKLWIEGQVRALHDRAALKEKNT